MITVKCDGLTEYASGKNRKLNFVFNVDDSAAPVLLGDALKVRFRAKYRKHTADMADGDTIIVNVSMDGDTVSLKMIDEKEQRKAELMETILNGSPEEMIEAAAELKVLLTK